MTQPPLGGISGTVRAVSNIRVPLVSSGQVCLHLKYAALQLGLHRVEVASSFFIAPRDDGAVVFHCSERYTPPVCVYPWNVHHQIGDDVAVCEIAGRGGQGVRHAVARRRQQNTPRGGDCKLTTCCARYIADRAVSTQKEVRHDLLAASELHCQSGHGSRKSDARKKQF